MYAFHVAYHAAHAAAAAAVHTVKAIPAAPVISAVTAPATHSSAITAAPSMDLLMLFGFSAAFVTFTCFFYRNHSRSAAIAVTVGLFATALYAFLQGAWPVGLVQTLLAGASIRHAGYAALAVAAPTAYYQSKRAAQRPAMVEASRMKRMFESN